jgi:hypothetical protein
VYLPELVFEESLHLFGAEHMTAKHAIVTHLLVKIHSAGMAFWAGYSLALWFGHLPIKPHLWPERLL